MTSLAGELLEERRNHRRAVIRQAVIYTPLSIGVTALLGISLWSVVNGAYGALIAATILALIAVAVIFQSVAALRDLRAQPMATSGMVRRAWTKGMFLGFIRSHYILVQRAVFDVSIVSYTQLVEGDEVEVRHWPHTKTVIEVRKLKRASAPKTNPASPESYRSVTEDGGGTLDGGIGRIQNAPFEGPYS